VQDRGEGEGAEAVRGLWGRRRVSISWIV
jgi:hypothetical protein